MGFVKSMNNVNLLLKRIFDILFAAVGIVFLSPLFFVLALCVRLGSKGPIFFKQIRVGKDEKYFKIFKFRTMIIAAETKGLSITVGEDIRITRIGRFLRKTKLDEIPQLFNILRGDMSLVGPRPEVIKYVNMYNEEQRQVLRVRPGITDYASICFRNENEILAMSEDPESEYINNIMPLKIKYGLKYIEEMNLFTDMKVLCLTVWVVCGGKVEIKV